MAVQAEHPSTATTAMAAFSLDHGVNTKAPPLNGGALSLPAGGIPSAPPMLQPEPFECPTVLSGEPGSELTFNVSSLKRKRMHQCQMGLLLPPPPQQLRAGDLAAGNVHGAGWGALFGGSHVPYKTNRSYDLGTASTAGFPAAASSPATSPLAQHLALQLCHQSVDIDDLVRLQCERLRSELEEMNKSHFRAVLSVMQQGGLRHLRQKVMEIEFATRRRADLEQKVRQMEAENEMWVSLARSNEAIACDLRSSLGQLMLKDVNQGGAITPEEGYGDSDSVTPAAKLKVDQETRLDLNHGDSSLGRVARGREREEQGKCRVCLEGQASVLLLPCRHLCLCEQCKPRVAAACCPLCEAAISATLHVFFG